MSLSSSSSTTATRLRHDHGGRLCRLTEGLQQPLLCSWKSLLWYMSLRMTLEK
ncbi:unnamed protein product, partial [Citrullus colocynthis]